jgi:hypothetical protein
MTRADKFLEGFKLGSLGVSHKPRVEPRAAIEIVKEGKNNLEFDDNDLLYFCWKEDSDGWSYYLGMDRLRQDVYMLQLWGGKKLTVSKGTVAAWKNWIVPSGPDWNVPTKGIEGYEKAESLFKDLVSSIHRNGIDGFLSQENLSNFDLKGAFGFDHWLEQRKKGGEGI